LEELVEVLLALVDKLLEQSLDPSITLLNELILQPRVVNDNELLNLGNVSSLDIGYVLIELLNGILVLGDLVITAIIHGVLQETTQIVISLHVLNLLELLILEPQLTSLIHFELDVVYGGLDCLHNGVNGTMLLDLLNVFVVARLRLLVQVELLLPQSVSLVWSQVQE
jgi:hypothetical protein